MTRDHASLQRRPFLTPIWLVVFAGFVAVVVLVFAGWVWGTANSTTVVVVRHAEKQPDGGDDPPLSAAGEARAALLARMFGDRREGCIDAIYVAPTLRSRSTAAPLAARIGVMPVAAPADAPRDLARRALHEHAGGRILIVGRSDTVPGIVEALSGVKRLPPIADEDYGTLYVVSVPRIGRANVLRMTF